jgi:hypothetical protein
MCTCTHSRVTMFARSSPVLLQAPPVYAVLYTDAKKGIGDKDHRWDDILTRDCNGFMGLTTFAPIPCRPAHQKRYSEQGLLCSNDTAHGPAIMVVSEPPSVGDRMMHSAVKVAEGDYVLPPLTLLAVKEVLDEIDYLPGMPSIKQKCIVLRPTFMMSPGTTQSDSLSSKFTPPATVLTCAPRGPHTQPASSHSPPARSPFRRTA